MLFNTKLSIWLYLYNFYLSENSLFGETSFLLSFTSFHMVSFGSSNVFKKSIQSLCLGFKPDVWALLRIVFLLGRGHGFLFIFRSHIFFLVKSGTFYIL